MKTKNNVQKAITKSLAVIISLVLLSLTVNAQEFWNSVFKNNSFTQIAMAMANENPGPSHYEAKHLSSKASFSVLFVPETEPALVLEGWMKDDLSFTSWMGMLETEAEPALELQNWMMNEDSFGVKTLIIEQEKESALQLEDWMVNSKVWKM